MDNSHAGSLAMVVLRRDRLVVGGAVACVVALCWIYLWTGAGTMQEMGGMLMPMSAGPWTPFHAALMFVMWTVMMVAMMLPSAAPMILLYTTIARKRREKEGIAGEGEAGKQAANPAIFAFGYLAVWTAFSVAAVTLQYGLERAALLSPMMQTTSLVLAAAVLMATGAYQWTPFKQACLRHCRSPLQFVLTHWQEGRKGAFMMGAQHGAYCAGCCWMLMFLLFVGGIMNLGWIAGLALFVMAEKFLPGGNWIGRVAGLFLIVWGAGTLGAGLQSM